MVFVKEPAGWALSRCQAQCGSPSRRPPPSTLAFCNLGREQQQNASRAIYRDQAIPTAAEIRLQKRLVKIFFLELL